MEKLRDRLLTMHTPRAWLAFGGVVLLFALVIPGLNAWTAPDSALHVPE
jgi:hypothetical protein